MTLLPFRGIKSRRLSLIPEDKEDSNDGDFWENPACQGKRVRRPTNRIRGGTGNAFGVGLSVLGPDLGRGTGE